MNKQSTNKKIRNALYALLILIACSHGVAHGAPDGCPAPAKELKDIDCNTEENKKKPKCAECAQTIMDQRSEMKNNYNTSRDRCTQTNTTCQNALAQFASCSSNPRQSVCSTTGKALNEEGATCARKKEALSAGAKSFAKGCEEALEKSCQGIKDADKEKAKCKAAKEEAEKTEKENKAKAAEADKNAAKNGDNAKKEESAGGGMPQMPQIPQMPQSQEEKPPEMAQYPTNSDPTISSSTAPQIETSKFDDGKSDIASPHVGFGSTGTGTDVKTGLGTDASFPAQSFATEGVLRSPSGDNSLGDQNAAGGASASVPGGSGGGGLAGGGNSTGASRPGEGGEAKAAETANPYEVAVGSGGRLGVPKGKSAGDSDSPIDAAATANFNGDFKTDGGGATDQASGGEEEDVGYTIFKMVKYRYAELKKKGNI